MKNYETRLQADLSAIQESVGRLAAGVREAVDEAVRGVLSRDRDRMYAVILNDLPYNRLTRAIDQSCHAFVARHIPAAGHLRFVSSVLRLTIGLERIGDYAVTICRVGVHLDDDLQQQTQDHIRSLADQSGRMLELATRAFLRNDAELARDTMKMAKAVDRTHDRVFQALIEQSASGRTMMDVLRLQTIYDKLERVSDQAKNLCEEAVFVTTGETKQPKVYTILFLDHGDDMLAPLAEALARRSFPESGAYTSSGLRAANDYDPVLLELADELQLDLGGPVPTTVDPSEFKNYYLIVPLNVAYAEISEIPFHTAVQRWTIDTDAPRADLVRDLSDRITTLMETLRGDSAS